MENNKRKDFNSGEFNQKKIKIDENLSDTGSSEDIFQDCQDWDQGGGNHSGSFDIFEDSEWEVINENEQVEDPDPSKETERGSDGDDTPSDIVSESEDEVECEFCGNMMRYNSYCCDHWRVRNFLYSFLL